MHSTHLKLLASTLRKQTLISHPSQVGSLQDFQGMSGYVSSLDLLCSWGRKCLRAQRVKMCTVNKPSISAGIEIDYYHLVKPPTPISPMFINVQLCQFTDPRLMRLLKVYLVSAGSSTRLNLQQPLWYGMWLLEIQQEKDTLLHITLYPYF